MCHLHKWHQVVRVFYIGCLHTVHFMLHLGPYKYVGCGFAIFNHTKDGDMLVHDKMSPGMCVAFCLKKELKYGSINGATGYLISSNNYRFSGSLLIRKYIPTGKYAIAPTIMIHLRTTASVPTHVCTMKTTPPPRQGTPEPADLLNMNTSTALST